MRTRIHGNYTVIYITSCNNTRAAYEFHRNKSHVIIVVVYAMPPPLSGLVLNPCFRPRVFTLLRTMSAAMRGR